MSNLGMAVNKNPSKEKIVAGIDDDDVRLLGRGGRAEPAGGQVPVHAL